MKKTYDLIARLIEKKNKESQISHSRLGTMLGRTVTSANSLEPPTKNHRLCLVTSSPASDLSTI